MLVSTPAMAQRAGVKASTSVPSGSCVAPEVRIIQSTGCVHYCNGTVWSDLGCVGGGVPTIKEAYFPAAGLLALEHAADSIAPLVKEEGTNADLLVRAFDDTVDECVGGTFTVPSDITTTGSDTVTFRIRWYSPSVTTNDAMFDFRWHEVGDNESWDGAMTTEEAGAVTTAGTIDLITLDTWTETITNLGWSANDMIEFELCRDADSTGTGIDNLVGDAYVIDFAVEMIRE